MRAGRLDRRLTIQRWAASGQDAHGQETGAWQTQRIVWAERRFIAGAERLTIAQAVAGQTEIFRVRGGVDVTPADRVVMDGVAFDVQSVAELGRGAGLEITAAATAEDFAGQRQGA
jgi:SPP1 family predicted phage head-tail adaptor